MLAFSLVVSATASPLIKDCCTVMSAIVDKLMTPQKEWKSTKIGNVLSIGSGRDYKHLEDGNIPVYGTGGYMLSVDSYLYDGESVLARLLIAHGK